jgi:hypothetical protein
MERKTISVDFFIYLFKEDIDRSQVKCDTVFCASHFPCHYLKIRKATIGVVSSIQTETLGKISLFEKKEKQQQLSYVEKSS